MSDGSEHVVRLSPAVRAQVRAAQELVLSPSVQRTLDEVRTSQMPAMLSAYARAVEASGVGDEANRAAASFGAALDTSAFAAAVLPDMSRMHQVANALAVNTNAFGRLALPNLSAVMATWSAQVFEASNAARAMFDQFERIWAPHIKGLADLVARYRRALPVNVAESDADLFEVVALGSEHGVPISWVVPSDLIGVLLESGDNVWNAVEAHRDEILEACVTSASGCEPEVAARCLEAVGVLRAGFDGPAQTHAATIIDSVIQDHRRRVGWTAHTLAGTDPDKLNLSQLADYLAVLPLVGAWKRWYPDAGDPPPDRFSRHTTVHAVHLPGVVTPRNALCAVMLACSLARQLCAKSAAAAA